MNTNLAVVGSFHEKPFNYQQFHLRELGIIRGGRAIFSLDIIYPCRPFVTKMKAMQFNEDFSVLPMKVFQNHYILVFDLTSLQDAAEQLHYPELSGESLRLERFFFIFPLEQITDNFGTNSEQSLKIFNCFEFSDSYKVIVTFLGLFLLLSLYYLFCFSSDFRPKAPEKIEKNAV